MGKKIKAIVGGVIYTPQKRIEEGVVLVSDKKITALGEVDIPRDAQIIEAKDKLVTPGFIDLHIHGGAAHDFMDASFEAIDAISKIHSQYGTTSLLATTLTASHDEILKAIRAIVKAKERGTSGAKILGIHLEGPYISKDKKGAQNPDYIRLPELGEVKELIKEGKGNIKIVVLAPEVKGSKELIRYLVREGIVVSCGHSNADYEETIAGIEEGITQATHTFCAMSGLHHRAPGVVGAILTSDKVVSEIIADGVHVHPPVMRLLIKTKGIERIVLITDCVQALGLPEGEYNLGGLKVTYREGTIRIDKDTLAGSVLTMNKAVENVVRLVGLSLREALFMATLNPARVLKIDHKKGSLQEGKDADLVIMDKNFKVVMTIVEGKIVYGDGG